MTDVIHHYHHNTKTSKDKYRRQHVKKQPNMAREMYNSGSIFLVEHEEQISQVPHDCGCIQITPRACQVNYSLIGVKHR